MNHLAILDHPKRLMYAVQVAYAIFDDASRSTSNEWHDAGYLHERQCVTVCDLNS